MIQACGDRAQPLTGEKKDLPDDTSVNSINGGNSGEKTITGESEPTQTLPVPIVRNNRQRKYEIYEETPLSSSPESPESKIFLPLTSQPKSLQQEFSLVDTSIPNLSVEEVNRHIFYLKCCKTRTKCDVWCIFS